MASKVIDVLDGLSNGTRGELVAVIKNSKGQVDKLIIKFDEEYQGFQKRQKSFMLLKKYPGCTPIEKYLCSYSLAKKQQLPPILHKCTNFLLSSVFRPQLTNFRGPQFISQISS